MVGTRMLRVLVRTFSGVGLAGFGRVLAAFGPNEYKTVVGTRMML